MADSLIFDQTLNFSQDAEFSAYSSYVTGENVFSLTDGKRYSIEFDGVTYTCFAGVAQGNIVCIGNAAVAGLQYADDTEEPFCIFYAPTDDGSYQNIVFASDQETTHSVKVYDLENQNGYLIENKTLGFSVDSTTSLYAYQNVAYSFALLTNETYTVVWDGELFVVTAEDISVSGMTPTVLGNKAFLGAGDSTNHPFLVAYMSSQGYSVYTSDTASSHEVSVYRGDLTASGGGSDDSTTDSGYLMQNQTLAFALQTNSETIYYNDVTADGGLETAPAITVGNTYTVIWDGKYYECVAKEYTDSLTFVVLGNLSIAVETEENTGEPFVYLYVTESKAEFQTLETDASHVVSIYNGVLEEPVPETVNLVLLDRNGNSVTYEGIKTVSFNTPDGKIATFILSAISS